MYIYHIVEFSKSPPANVHVSFLNQFTLHFLKSREKLQYGVPVLQKDHTKQQSGLFFIQRQFLIHRTNPETLSSEGFELIFIRRLVSEAVTTMVLLNLTAALQSTTPLVLPLCCSPEERHLCSGDTNLQHNFPTVQMTAQI